MTNRSRYKITTKSEVSTITRALYARCEEVLAKGQSEYASGTDNGFANFERIGAELGLTREKVLLVFARKHWDGIIAHVNGHEAQREDVTGRIEDLVVYLGLLYAMYSTKDEGRSTDFVEYVKNLVNIGAVDKDVLPRAGEMAMYQKDDLPPIVALSVVSDPAVNNDCGVTLVVGRGEDGRLYVLDERWEGR